LQLVAVTHLHGVVCRDMLGLKRQYEAAVETRNYTGIQLIDRCVGQTARG